MSVKFQTFKIINKMDVVDPNDFTLLTMAIQDMLILKSLLNVLNLTLESIVLATEQLGLGTTWLSRLGKLKV